MKRLIVLLFIVICCYNAIGQTTYPRNLPTVKSDSGWYKIGYMQPSVYGVITQGDTAIRPNINGAMRFWKNPGVDTALWVWSNTRWLKISSTASSGVNWGSITGNIYNQTDLINYIDSFFSAGIATDTLNLSYRIDTIGRKVIEVIYPLVAIDRTADTTTLYYDSTNLDQYLTGVDTLNLSYRIDTISFRAPYCPSGFLEGLVPQVSWIDSLKFEVTAGGYFINCGGPYFNAWDSVTLSAADPTLNRIDVIAVDIYGNVVVIEGDPATTPSAPQIDPSTQLYLTQIYIPAASFVPQGVVRTVVYDEDLGTPSEFNTTFSTSWTAVSNATTAPYHLTKNIDVGTNTTTKTITFTTTPALVSTDYSLLKMFINLKASLAGTTNVSVRFYNGTVAVTPAVTLTAAFGFNKTIPDYQNITIPFSAIAFSSTTFTNIRVTIAGASSGFYLDYVQLQGGIPNGLSPYITDVFRKTGTDSVFQVINSVPEFAFIDSSGGGGSDTTIFGAYPPFEWTQIGDTLYGGVDTSTALIGLTTLYQNSLNVKTVTSANADITVSPTTINPVITMVQAPALRSASTTIDVSAATAPTTGQVLTATSGTAATWQTPAAGGAGWALTGNAGITAYDNFLGTTDAKSLWIRTNDQVRMKVDSTTGFVGINQNTPTTYLHVKGDEVTPTFGSELINTANYTSTGWTTVVAGTYTHNTGNTTALTNTLAGVVGTDYRVLVTVTGRTAGTFTVTFGGVISATITPTSGTFYAEIPIVATTTGTLSVTPLTTFDGTVTLSIKTATANSNPILIAGNSTTTAYELRTDTTSNLFMGSGAGARNIAGNGAAGTLDGQNNIGVGLNALAINVSGGSDVAIGANAMANGKNISTSVAIGNNAFKGNNATGGGNIAIGSGGSSTTGIMINATSAARNTIIGGFGSNSAVAGGAITSGIEHTIIGNEAAKSQTAGQGVTAIGRGALFVNSTGGFHTAVGYNSFLALTATATISTAVGAASGAKVTTGSLDALGYNSGALYTTGLRNVAVGNSAAAANSGTWTGDDNTSVGNLSGQGPNAITGLLASRNTFIGAASGGVHTTGANDNTSLGYKALYGNATDTITGANNIGIGSMAKLPSRTLSSQITFWVAATGGTGGYNALTRFAGAGGTGTTGGWVVNHTAAAVTTQTTGAALEVKSTTGVFMPPVMTGAEATSLETAGAPNGGIIYVTSTDGVFTSVGFWGRIAGTWTALHL